jgi:signal transduction histidine kinase
MMLSSKIQALGKKINLQNKVRIAMLSAAFLAISYLLQWTSNNSGPKAALHSLQRAVQSAEVALEKTMSDTAQINSIIRRDNNNAVLDGLGDKPFVLALYKIGRSDYDETLIAWSNNTILPPESDITFSDSTVRGVQNLKGIKYLQVVMPYRYKGQKYVIAGIIPLHFEYSITNDYLQSGFVLSPNADRYLTFSQVELETPIKSKSGEVLFHVKVIKKGPSQLVSGIILVLFLLGWLGLLYASTHLCGRAKLGESGLINTLCLALIFIGLRAMVYVLGLPNGLAELSAFMPYNNTDSHFTRSLGDFLINAILIYWLVLFLYQHLQLEVSNTLNRLRRNIRGTALYAAVVIGLLLLHNAFYRVILYTNISLNINEIITLKPDSLLGLTGLTLLMIAYFILASKLMGIASALRVSNQYKFSLLMAYLGVGLVLVLSGLIGVKTGTILLFAAAFIAIHERFNQQNISSVVWIASWLVFFSAFSASLMYSYNREEELSYREKLAKRIALERDPIFEKDFFAIEENLQEDRALGELYSLGFRDLNSIADRFNSQYLDNSFFVRYAYEYILVLNNEYVLPQGTTSFSIDQLNQYMKTGTPTASNRLVFQSTPDGRYFYLARISYASGARVLYIMFKPKPRLNSNVYIDLLTQREQKLNTRAYEYNFTLYKNRKAVYQEGEKLPDTLGTPFDQAPRNASRSFQKNGNDYLVFHAENDNIAIISRDKDDALRPVSLFSYMFSFIFLVLFGLILLTRRFPVFPQGIIDAHPFRSSLRGRVQVAMVSLVLFAFATIATITIIYYQKVMYTDYHRLRLARKVDRLVEDAQHQVDLENYILQSRDAQKRFLDNLVTSHDLVVNLFNQDGSFMESSYAELFERKLQAKQMHPLAFEDMVYKQGNIFIQRERIGNYSYQAAYAPLKNIYGERVAFLHIPYGSSDSMLRRQDAISFLTTLLNVYVLLLIIAGLLAVLVSSSITRPLAIIADKLRTVAINKPNEPLSWDRNDEIGSLIERYNEMIVKLEASTRELANSQKEMAWREMAKQVAHEIKNPLTPMKLNIQLLQRAFQSDPERAREMSGRVTQSLIEQIDNLSHIASEFSTFAKMPEAQNEKLLLNEVVRSTFTLFQEQESPQFMLSLDICAEELMVWADKGQISRVLTNLLKNAMQAIPNEQQGIIELSLQRKGKYALVRVKDNGTGIPDDKKNEIFVPNFTTKNSGMGIGLSMSKNIIESIDGHIYFESTVGQGTVFSVELPLVP